MDVKVHCEECSLIWFFLDHTSVFKVCSHCGNKVEVRDLSQVEIRLMKREFPNKKAIITNRSLERLSNTARAKWKNSSDPTDPKMEE